MAVLLLVLVALEILPCSCLPDSSDLLSGTGEISCRFEPLQTCGDDGLLLGALAGHPVLVSLAAVPFAAHEFLSRTPEGAVFLPDGFKPAVDRPPESPA